MENQDKKNKNLTDKEKNEILDEYSNGNYSSSNYSLSTINKIYISLAILFAAIVIFKVFFDSVIFNICSLVSIVVACSLNLLINFLLLRKYINNFKFDKKVLEISLSEIPSIILVNIIFTNFVTPRDCFLYGLVGVDSAVYALLIITVYAISFKIISLPISITLLKKYYNLNTFELLKLFLYFIFLIVILTVVIFIALFVLMIGGLFYSCNIQGSGGYLCG